MKRMPRQWEYYNLYLTNIESADDALRDWTGSGWEVVNFTENKEFAQFPIIAWLRRELQ